MPCHIMQTGVTDTMQEDTGDGMQDGSSPTLAAIRNSSRDCESSGSSSPVSKVATMGPTETSEQSITSRADQLTTNPHLSGWERKELTSTGCDKAADLEGSSLGDADPCNGHPEPVLMPEAPSAVLGKSEVLGQPPVQYTIDVNASGAEHIVVHCERETADSESE